MAKKWEKKLTDAELAEIIGNLAEEEDDFPDAEDDDDSELDDHQSVASEEDDYMYIDETDTENEESESTPDLIYKAKDGTEWQNNPYPTGRARSHNIIKSKLHKVILKPGKIVEEPEDAFFVFVDNKIVDRIATCTNKEAVRVLTPEKWKFCDTMELYAFFGLLFTAGHLKNNDTNYDILWNSLYGPPIFRATMGLKRFKSLLRFIRFDDKDTRTERRRSDKLAPIREIWDEINANLLKHYLPGGNITIDEQLVPYRGRCPFIQYMPSKPDKYGMKIWWACDSETYYPLCGIPYTGKEGNAVAKGLANQVVQKLAQPYYNTNRNVTCDNYFTSLDLALTLLRNSLTIVGTVKKNKTFVPTEFLPRRNREEKTSIFGFTKKVSMVSYVPKRNKGVVVLSTMHHNMECSTEDHKKPEIILYYNSTKGGVDTMDQMVHEYMCKRKTNRWPFAFFMNLLDVTGIAAYVIWTNLYPSWNQGKHERRRLFLTHMAENLVLPHIRRRKPAGLGKVTKMCMGQFSTEEDEPQAKKRCTTATKKRCFVCPNSKHRKQKQVCTECKRNVCNEHSKIICNICKP